MGRVETLRALLLSSDFALKALGELLKGYFVRITHFESRVECAGMNVPFVLADSPSGVF